MWRSMQRIPVHKYTLSQFHLTKHQHPAQPHNGFRHSDTVPKY